MPEFLDLNRLPEYSHSSFRYFEKHEKHITRVCLQDVLVMIFDGTLRFYENGVPVEVPKGSFYIQKKGIPYDGVVESDEPQYYYIHFLGNFTWTTACRFRDRLTSQSSFRFLESLTVRGSQRRQGLK